MPETATLLTSLVSNMAVIVVVAYVITRTQFHVVTEVLERRVTLKSQAFLIAVFGAFSIYGTLAGIPVFGAIANTRDLGPAIAGLVGGPLVGLGAGLIGGIHRYCYGLEFTAVPCGLATITIGLAAGLVRRWNGGRFIGIPGAVLFMVVAELFHGGLNLALARPFSEAWALISAVEVPMILANGAGMAVFALIITNLMKERRVQAERDAYLLEKERTESELRVARDIQMSMVPKRFAAEPPDPRYDLFAALQPAREVGGDLYLFFPLGEDHLLLAVADVSGKGVPAALFMAMTTTLLKGFAQPGVAPAELLAHANATLARNNPATMFVTLFCAILDLRTGRLAYSNAGHNPPVLLTAEGRAEALKLPPGLVLGVSEAATYRTEEIVLAPGEALVAYTDGVTEAANPAEVLFTEARLREVLGAHATAGVEEIVGGVLEAVSEFAAGAPQSDDIALLAVRYTGPG